MKNFKQFLTESEEKDNIENLLKKLPKKLRNSIKKYKFDYQSGMTINGDKEHVGKIDSSKKTITISAPFFFSREFTTLHEIAHFFWEKFLTKQQKEEWGKLIKQNDLNKEEIFCHSFSNFFSKYPLLKYNNDKTIKFIEKVLKEV